MYLTILSKHGDKLVTLNTTKRLPADEAAKLIWSLQSGDGSVHAVGALSQEKDLNKLPRFANGALKLESAPTTIRGEALLEYIHSLTKVGLKAGGNLKPAWTSATAPRRVTKITPAQAEQVRSLKSAGFSQREVASKVGLSLGTINGMS